MNLLPAIVIGGPPHSGKSVLAYSLSRALRQRDMQHYVLRAYPDGEGSWANQADQELVHAIRIKGFAGPEWIRRICRDIANRHLPLIVDPGGRPTGWQEAVFDCCTHAILLTPAGDDEGRDWWRAMLLRHGLAIIADLRSDLHGLDAADESGPALRGRLAGLERGKLATGPAFEALVERVFGIFAYTPAELRHLHLQIKAPVELVLELDRLGRTLDALDEAGEWLPQGLPRALDYLPPAKSLGLYDRAPNWLYAGLALYAYPETLYQFDVRLGWIKPPVLRIGQPARDAPMQASLHRRPSHIRVEFVLRDNYLDYAEAEGLRVPPIPAGAGAADAERPVHPSGVVLSDKLPLWLWTAAALAYRDAPWLGVYQPRLHDQAVVVQSSVEGLSAGQLVTSSASLD